jgi:hypothetical protein
MTEQKQEWPRLCAGVESCFQSERSLGGLRRRRAGRRFRLLIVAIELAHHISANRPRRNFRGLRLLAFAVGLVVCRADERAFSEQVSLCAGIVYGEQKPGQCSSVCSGRIVLLIIPLS